MPCIVCYDCFVFTISSPSKSMVDPAATSTIPLPCATTSSTTVPLPSSFQASSAPSPLPHIAYLSLLFCCTRHMLLLHYNPIQLHSLSLSPLDYLSTILCCLKYIYIYIIFNSYPYALLVNRIR